MVYVNKIQGTLRSLHKPTIDSFFGGPCEELSELYNANLYVPIFITHFFNKPIQNPELLRTLYLLKDLSSYQIHKMTKSRWSRAAISDAIRLLVVKKEVRKSPVPRFGWKVQKNRLVPHKGEQATLRFMLKLHAEGWGYANIANYLNEKND